MSSEFFRPLSDTPTPALVSTLVQDTKQLVKAEVELAKAELKRDLKRELHMVEGFGIAALCALCTLNLVLVSVVFALAQSAMPGWAAALLVGACVLAVGTAAGLIGWSVRAKEPLQRTRKLLKEDVRWAKERMG